MIYLISNFILFSGKKTFRSDLYEDYKKNRPPAPDDLVPQFPLAPKVLEMLGCRLVNFVALHSNLDQYPVSLNFNWRCFESPDFEADDIIATLAAYGKTRFGL